jgi:hypothetical protein
VRSRTWRAHGLQEPPVETECIGVTRSSTRHHRAEPSTERNRVLETAFVAVDDLHCVNGEREQGPQGFSPDFQVCLPYRGALHLARCA